MEDLEFGPVELVLAAYDGDAPDAGVVEAVLDLVEAGTVRLLDLVHVARTADGIEFLELDETGIEFGEIELAGEGLVGEDDVNELGGRLPVGGSALLLVVELVWARHLASRLLAAGGVVVDSVRIPAPVVNAVVAEARDAL